MKQVQQNIERHIAALADFTATPGQGTTRLTYSQEDLLARNYIKQQMTMCGLDVREDGLGNIFGRLEGTLPDAPAVLIGSHFDSVPNGGNYDGQAGVVVALEVARLFTENHIKPKYPLEIIALIEEEGTRFGGGLLGSRGMMGLVSEAEFQTIKDQQGISTVAAMQAIGLDTTLPLYRDPKTVRAFLEMHIEQGPVLENQGIPIGIVEAIVGLTQLEITIQGRAGHAGTTPMAGRADALVVAAGIIAHLPDIALEVGNGAVITTGRLNVSPNGANVIPEKVVFTVDLRAGEESTLEKMLEKVKAVIKNSCKNDIKITWEQPLYMQPKRMNAAMLRLLKEACDTFDIAYCSMNSGAGHDAMVFADFIDSAMLFIPSKHGVSHCPEEWSDAAHIANAVFLFYETAKKLTES